MIFYRENMKWDTDRMEVIACWKDRFLFDTRVTYLFRTLNNRYCYIVEHGFLRKKKFFAAIEEKQVKWTLLERGDEETYKRLFGEIEDA